MSLTRANQRSHQHKTMSGAADKTHRADESQFRVTAYQPRKLLGQTKTDGRRSVKKWLGGVCEWIGIFPVHDHRTFCDSLIAYLDRVVQ